FSGFVVILTIHQSTRNKKAPTDELQQILENDEFGEVFLNYAKSEWSAENVWIWKDLQKFYSLNGKKKNEQAYIIYERYLKNYAEYEVFPFVISSYFHIR